MSRNKMEDVRVVSTSTVSAEVSESNGNSGQIIDLTPWDLQFLPIEVIQKGLIFRNNENYSPIQIQHLQYSLSSTLSYFPPLAGRLVTLQHQDNTVSSSHIICNNAGALFVPAIAPTTAVTDILQLKHFPPFLRAFFPLNVVQNHQSSEPLLAVQVTKLLDGIFIAIAINHVVTDGKSFWHFVNSWTQISRGSHKIERLPLLQRFFPDGVDRPVRFAKLTQRPTQTPLDRAVFHFVKEKIAELKAKANAEANTDKISSLQALLTLLWRSVIRCQRVEPHEDVHCVVLVGVRNRMVPQLAEDYFGNAVLVSPVTMKARELLQGGIGKGALEINKVVSLHSHEMIKKSYECWVKTPTMGSIAPNSLIAAGSPRFDIYGNDFGWGKAVAVRSCGVNNANHRKITLSSGAVQGSIEIEAFLPYENLEAIGNDPEIMDFVSNSN